MMQSWEPDKCCGKRLAKAIASGAITEVSTSWDCPECGCTWKPRTLVKDVHVQADGAILASVEHISLRHWEPHPAIELFEV